MWDRLKRSFEAWESTASPLLQRASRSRVVVAPVGMALTTAMRLLALRESALELWWSSLGLATRAEQERALHAVHRLEGRLADLEERLRDLEGREG